MFLRNVRNIAFGVNIQKLPPSPWWRRQYAPLKRRYTPTRLHGAKCHKTLSSSRKILFNIVLPTMPRFSKYYSHIKFFLAFLFSPLMFLSHLSHPPWFCHHKSIKWSKRIMTLFFVTFTFSGRNIRVTKTSQIVKLLCVREVTFASVITFSITPNCSSFYAQHIPLPNVKPASDR
jgi:hypothetical protein